MGDLLQTAIDAHGGLDRIRLHQAPDLPAHPDGQSLPEPLFVSIDLSEIEFTEAPA